MLMLLVILFLMLMFPFSCWGMVSMEIHWRGSLWRFWYRKINFEGDHLARKVDLQKQKKGEMNFQVWFLHRCNFEGEDKKPHRSFVNHVEVGVFFEMQSLPVKIFFLFQIRKETAQPPPPTFLSVALSTQPFLISQRFLLFSWRWPVGSEYVSAHTR